MPGLLCIHAHPDDELYCGGLVVELSRRGIPVHLVCVTRGEGGGLGRPPIATRQTVGSVREQETRCSASALGAASIEFLGYVDPVGTDGFRAPEHDPDEFKRDVLAAVARHRPAVILTHGSNGEYGHPAHVMVHEMVLQAVVSLGSEASPLYGFRAAHPGASQDGGGLNKDDPAHLVLDVSPHFERLLAAHVCHRTQNWGWIRQSPEQTDQPATLDEFVRGILVEAYHRHWPPVEGTPDDTLQEWLCCG